MPDIVSFLYTIRWSSRRRRCYLRRTWERIMTFLSRLKVGNYPTDGLRRLGISLLVRSMRGLRIRSNLQTSPAGISTSRAGRSTSMTGITTLHLSRRSSYRRVRSAWPMSVSLWMTSPPHSPAYIRTSMPVKTLTGARARGLVCCWRTTVGESLTLWRRTCWIRRRSPILRRSCRIIGPAAASRRYRITR